MPSIKRGNKVFFSHTHTKSFDIYKKSKKQGSGMTAIFHHKICQIVPEIISKPDRYPPMEHLSNDHENHPNQLKNSQKLCNEMWHLVQSLMES